MTMNARRPVNFRTFLIVAVCMICSIFCAYAYICVRALGIAAAVVNFFALTAFTVVSIVKYLRKKTRLGVVMTFALAVVLGVMSFSIGAVYGDMRKECSGYGGYREIEGRVCAADLRTGEYRVNIENVRLDGKSVYGNMRVKFSASDRNSAEFLACGDTITFSAFVTVVPLIDEYEIDGSSCRTSIIYYTTVDPEIIDISFGSPSPTERLLSGWRAVLIKNMGDRYGNIAFSMLTGDKYGLDGDISDTFSVAGLGHIMAVSGLHIGFMIALVNFALMRVDKRIRFPIIAVLLIGYTVIADFSPSVVRAAIMAAIAGLSVFVGGRRDLLSSLSCAFSLILAVKPLYLFDVGFLLSFGAIFGIAMFSNSIARFFKKHGAHYKIADGIGSAVSVQAGIAPTQLYFFNTVQPLAIVVNIVLIPYISIVFMTIVCCSVLGAIPYCGVVLKLPMYLLMPIDLIANGVSAIPFSSLKLYSTAAIFLCYPVMFFAGEFFMIAKGKLAVVAYSLAACLAFVFITAPVNTDMIAAVPYGSCAESLVCVKGEVYYVGYVDSRYATGKILDKYKITHIDGIYLLGVRNGTVDNVISLCGSVDIGAVYHVSFGSDEERLIDCGVDFRLIDENGNNAFKPVTFGGKFSGYERANVLFATDTADERVFDGYPVVRTVTVDDPHDGIIYLCNYCAVERENIITLDKGSYEYDLSASL